MLNLTPIMAKLTICMFLMMILFSGCDSFRKYQIVPNGPAWLGESLILTVKSPFIKRPIVWENDYYKYICDKYCHFNDGNSVLHSGYTSKLKIGEVSRSFSLWKVEDDNGNGGKLILDIKVKPKIKITRVNCEYTMKASDSFPVTFIKCFNGKKPLKFTDVSQSKSYDGKTFSKIATLSFSDFSGYVTCNFTIGKIFKESHRFHVDCKDSTPRNNVTIVALVSVFDVLFIIGCFVFNKTLRQIGTLFIEGDLDFFTGVAVFLVLLNTILNNVCLGLSVNGKDLISSDGDTILLGVLDGLLLLCTTVWKFLGKEDEEE